MNIRFLVPASDELADAVNYYSAQVAGLGQLFGQEVGMALTRIGQYPDAWQSSSPRTRRFLLKQFPYAVIYSVRHDEIVVVAVAHQHRRPGYWKARLS